MKRQIKINLTDAQMEAFEQAVKKDGDAINSQSGQVKRLMAEYTQRFGISFPEDENSWGGDRKSQIMKQADELTDYGQNDPAESV